jgi:hypothetical protein
MLGTRLVALANQLLLSMSSLFTRVLIATISVQLGQVVSRDLSSLATCKAIGGQPMPDRTVDSST